MSSMMGEEIKRWIARRNLALVLEIIQIRRQKRWTSLVHFPSLQN